MQEKGFVKTKIWSYALFIKRGFITNVGDSENSQVNIRGLEDCIMPPLEEEFHLETSSSEESKDEEWVSDDYGNVNNNTRF